MTTGHYQVLPTAEARSLVAVKVSLAFPPIAAHSSVNLMIAMYGANINDGVVCGLPASIPGNIVIDAFVSDVNTLTVRAHNYTDSTISPDEDYYAFTLITQTAITLQRQPSFEQFGMIFLPV